MAYLNRAQRLQEEERIIERWNWLTEDIDEYDVKLNTSIVL